MKIQVKHWLALTKFEKQVLLKNSTKKAAS